MDRLSLDGGVAVITGAARGIGKGIAEAAGRRGMKLVLADIATDAVFELANRFVSLGIEAAAITIDTSDPDALDHLAEYTYERFGSARLLVNNAGIETLGNTWELSAAQWDRTVNINVLGPIQGTRVFAARMIAEGKPAAIVNMASIGALTMMPEQTAYIVSKHAILSFSECLFLEMARAAPQIQVSVVLPGPVATGIFTHAPKVSGVASVDHHGDFMNRYLTDFGMSSEEAGESIIAQVEAGQFWIATHPEMLASAAGTRAQYLADLQRPALSEEARMMLGD